MHISNGWLSGLQQHGAELLEFLGPSHFLFQQRHHSQMEIRVEVDDLVQIFLLHLGPRFAHLALVLREQYLVDHDVPDVDLELGQLLNQPLGLIKGQKLGDQDRHECCNILL